MCFSERLGAVAELVFGIFNMTPDEVSKATAPNAIREASDPELDIIYNFAHGHLRGTDDGLLRQTQASIKAIQDEKLLRYNKDTRKISVWSLVISILIAILSIARFLYTVL